MAKDFSISSKVLDTDKYVYREERDLAKTQVDWGTVSKELTTTINTIRDERETQKAEIEKANTEQMNRAGEFDQYNNKTLNESVLEGSEWAKNALSVQMDHVRRGLITPSENKRYQQRVSDSFTFLKKNLSSFEADFNENNRRAEEGESTTLEQAINGSVAGLGILKNWELSGNAATGELAYVRAGNDPKTGEPYDANNPANQASLGTIGVRATNRTDYTSTTEMAQAEVGALAEVINSTLLNNQAVRTIEDWRNLDDSKKMMTGLVKTMTSTTGKIASIAQDKLGFTPETYDQKWTDDELANDPDKVRLIPDPSGSGDLIPDYSPEQIARVEEAARLSLESQIDQKIQTVKGFDPDSPAKTGARKEQSSSFGYIDQTMEVITGDNTEFNSAASSLKTAWDKANPDNPMDEDTPIDRSTDPNYILVNYANGEVEKIAKFELDAKGNQILNKDGQPIPVADELLVQNLLTKVAPVTGSTQGLMDEYLQENPDGLVDRGGRGEATSYQGTGEETFEPVSLASVVVDMEGGTLGDSFVEASKLDSGERGKAISAAVTETLAKTLKGITSNYEVQFDGDWYSNPTVTVTIDGEVEEITFDGRDPSDLQTKLQRVINERRAKGKGSKSSTSNNSGGKVR
jgi:hypothetical protein